MTANIAVKQKRSPAAKMRTTAATEPLPACAVKAAKSAGVDLSDPAECQRVADIVAERSRKTDPEPEERYMVLEPVTVDGETLWREVQRTGDLDEAITDRVANKERRILAGVLLGSPSRAKPVDCHPVAN